MNKLDLIRSIAHQAGVTQSEANRLLDTIVNVLTNTLANKESIMISGFGKFETVKRAAKLGRNPKTGEQFEIKESTAAVFRPGKLLKEATNG